MRTKISDATIVKYYGLPINDAYTIDARKKEFPRLSLSLSKKSLISSMTDASIVREESHWKKGKNGSMLNSVIRSVASGCIKLDLPSDKPRYPERRLLVSTPGTSERRKRVNKVKQGGEEERKRVGRKSDGQRGE